MILKCVGVSVCVCVCVCVDLFETLKQQIDRGASWSGKKYKVCNF